MATLHLHRKPDANRTGSADKRLNGWLRREQRVRYLREHPLCQACEAAGRITAATELDHVVPLSKGAVANAYDDTNLSGLCHACHVEKTRADLGQKPRGGCDESGMPTAPDHPWNK